MRMGIWVLLLFSVMSSGCAVVSSTDVNPSTIYSQYSANYDEATNKLDFNASFFVGGDTGTYVELSDKSSVLLDSQTMVKNKTVFNQIIYESEKTADSQSLAAAYTFVYTNDAGTIYRNAVQIPVSVSLSTPQFGSTSIASGVSVNWQATTAVGAHENIQAILKSANTAASESSWSGGSSGQITFSPQELKDFRSGPATITLCRQSYTTDVQGAAAGGSLSVSYCATPMTLTLTQ